MKRLVYTIVLVAAFQFAQGQKAMPLFYVNQQFYTTFTLEMPQTGYAYTFGVAILNVNTSSDDLPAGTILTYSISINGGEGVERQDTLIDALQKDSTDLAHWVWAFQFGPSNSHVGENSICIKVTKVDGVDIPSDGNDLCAKYTFTANGIADVNVLKESKIYPNPVSGNLKIENLQDVTEIGIYNVTGQLVRTVSSAIGNTEIDMSDLSNGMYIIKMQNGKSVRTEKIQVLK